MRSRANYANKLSGFKIRKISRTRCRPFSYICIYVVARAKQKEEKKKTRNYEKNRGGKRRSKVACCGTGLLIRQALSNAIRDEVRGPPLSARERDSPEGRAAAVLLSRMHEGKRVTKRSYIYTHTYTHMLGAPYNSPRNLSRERVRSSSG